MSTVPDIRSEPASPHPLPNAGAPEERIDEHTALRSSIASVREAFESVAGFAGDDGARGVPTGAREPCLTAVEALARLLSASFRREREIDALGQAVAAAPRLHARARLLLREHQAFKWELARIRAEVIGVRGLPGWRQLAARFDRLTQRLASHQREENEIVASAFLDDIGAGD